MTTTTTTTFLLVRHAETIRVALLDALGVDQDDFWRLEICPASVRVLTVNNDDGGTRRVLRFNDASALRD